MNKMQIKCFHNHERTASRSEIAIVIIILFVFLFISLAQVFMVKNLGPWQDEVMFIDPAANLYFGNGFTSSAWFAQTKDKFWAGYTPLYSFLLYLWMQLFGFGVYTARSFNCLLAATCALTIWQAAIRLNLITSAINRLILITILLLQLGYIIYQKQGRPDVLMASFAAVALLAYSVELSSRYVLLSCICVLFPFAGVALSAYTVILSALVLIYLRQQFFKEFISIAIGLFVGFICIYIFYSVNGVWDDFIISIFKNPTILLFSQRDKIGGFFGNRIFQILVILCLALVIYKVIKGQFKLLSVLSFGLVAIFWIPLGMRLVGAFPFYYSWMVVVPLAICVCSSLDDQFRTVLSHRLSFPILGTILNLCMIISPYLNFINLVSQWHTSNYSYVEAFVEKNIKENEWVYSDPIAYFAAKKRGITVIYKYYLNVITSEEKEKISVLIIRPEELSLLQDQLGVKWHQHGESLTIRYQEKFVELGVYRRK